MLEIKNLFKRFKGATKDTLNNVNLKVENGEVFGLIGKNGAGKSTTIKCFMGILPFERGIVKIKGIDLSKKPKEAKQMLGYVPDDHSVYETLTGREYINFMGDIYGVATKKRLDFIEEYAKLFNLTNSLDKQIIGYSHGMRQKICMMGSIVHKPSLWVLDEPMLGLDPQSVVNLCKTIKDYTKDKTCSVIFSSHNLDIVEKICDRVCIINNGEVVEIFDLKNKTKKFDLEKKFLEYAEGTK